MAKQTLSCTGYKFVTSTKPAFTKASRDLLSLEAATNRDKSRFRSLEKRELKHGGKLPIKRKKTTYKGGPSLKTLEVIN